MNKVLLMMALSTTAAFALPTYETQEEAQTAAAQNHRSIILDFTGTDWCPACIHLSNKIFKSSETDAAVGDKYCVVPVDFPRTPALVEKIAPEERDRRERLLQSYGIQGLPTVVILDEKGLPYGLIVGATKTPAEYLPKLAEVEKTRAARDAALEKAAGLQGVERARALDEALKVLPEVCRDKYTELVDEIIAADAEDELGYAAVRRHAENRVKQAEDYRKLCEEFAGKLKPEELRWSIGRCEEFLAQPDLEPEIRQQVLGNIADAYAFLRDFKKNIDYTRQALEAAPESRMAPKLKGHIEYYEQNIAPNLDENGNLKGN